MFFEVSYDAYFAPTFCDIDTDGNNVTIYNMHGQSVETLVNQRQEAGVYKVTWQATNQAAGLYYCRLQAGDQEKTGKLLLLK